MNKSQKLLSDIAIFNKYAKYQENKKRRENWEEIIDRYLAMMKKKYKKDFIHKMLDESEAIIKDYKTLPSMRALQFAGPAIKKNESRIYNCAYLPIDHYAAFSETMFLLLGGTGVGYSVQRRHIENLPKIVKPQKERKFLIGDSIEGWADAVKALMKSYFGVTKAKPRFDYSDIREKGTRLVTAGGKAPGPGPLKICLANIETILDGKQNEEKLTDLEVHDIICHIADAVLAGGIRRAALISLFSHDSIPMLTAKTGAWWEHNPQRGRANNSAVLVRGQHTEEDFYRIWDFIKHSNSGEPGIYWTNDPDYGTNPCCEISLRPFTFCNLCEISGSNIKDKKDLFERGTVAAFLGTLQAGFTDFHYLRPIWKENTEKDALIGVGITGICNGDILEYDLTELADKVKEVNYEIANIIGIQPAARTTTIKPSGTTSCVLGTSSGIHAWHSKHYIRNMQCTIGDDLYNYFIKYHPRLIKEMDYQPGSAVIGIPQRAPDKAILREEEDALEFLARVKRFNLEWVRRGHNRGVNTNNVSATCSIDDMKGEWSSVGEWMWENQDSYNGLSVLPFNGGTYKDAPFMTCSKKTYEDLTSYIEKNPIDLTKILEDEDHTSLRDSLACSGNQCEIL